MNKTELKKKLLPEIREIAKNYNIKGISKFRKDQLIDKIIEAEQDRKPIGTVAQVQEALAFYTTILTKKHNRKKCRRIYAVADNTIVSSCNINLRTIEFEITGSKTITVRRQYNKELFTEWIAALLALNKAITLKW